MVARSLADMTGLRKAGMRILVLRGPASVGLATPGRVDVTEQDLPGQFDPRSEGRW